MQRQHDLLSWLASEPFRVFFFSGAVWSVIGVTLWPLFYGGTLGYYPAYSHARIMIEAFGGAFVVGFLGTAGPRMASAPKLKPWELVWLFLLHQGSAICHLILRPVWGDALFALLLMSLAGSLGVRVIRFRQDPPPPQLLLALVGLASGISGALFLMMPATQLDPQRLRLGNLLLYQGLLLAPTLGIGSFIFPRMLGGEFGEPKTSRHIRSSLIRAIATAVLIISSFMIEAWGQPMLGGLIRAATCAAYLLTEIHWRKSAESPPRGTLANGMRAALICGLLGLVLASFFAPQRVSLEHLIYIGGFGLLILVVACRVLFGHSGELAAFGHKGGVARWLVGLAFLAATTRAVTAFLPQLTMSHHIYAAITWVAVALLWLIWNRKRFVRREEE